MLFRFFPLAILILSLLTGALDVGKLFRNSVDILKNGPSKANFYAPGLPGFSNSSRSSTVLSKKAKAQATNASKHIEGFEDFFQGSP